LTAQPAVGSTFFHSRVLLWVYGNFHMKGPCCCFLSTRWVPGPQLRDVAIEP
jgi:hypothetical protein